MSASTSRRGGKTTMLQPFPRNLLEKWKERTEQSPNKVSGVLEGVWNGTTSHAQLASLKKLSGVLGVLAESGSLPASLLLVLVEMHAVCLSRHPLQRTIASLLQGLPGAQREQVTHHVDSTIEAVLTRGLLSDHIHCLQYLEALGENFPLGELALWKQLPLVVEYCVSVLECCYNEKRLTDPLFIASLKTFTAILHKTQSLVNSLLSGQTLFWFSTSDTASSEVVSWPEAVGDQSTELRVQWVTGLLERGKSVCESLLKTGVGVPHDLSLNAAMLYVVITLRTIPASDSLDPAITCITTDWLGTMGSPLNSFSRLAVCHALLAKLPPPSLLVEAGGKPCLLQLFPIISALFDSFTETSDRYIAARTLALWTTIAKQCVGLVAEVGSVYEALLPSGPLISSVLQCVWALWEDPIDGIRHQCKLMFENVIGICQQLQQAGSSSSPSPFLLSLTDSLLSLTSPTRGKYQLLSTLSHHLPVTTLLLTSPTLPADLLSAMGHQALACHAGELWTRLVKSHWDNGQVPLATWSKTWLETIVEFMVAASTLSRQHTIQHCLPCLFECCPDSMDLIRSSLQRLTTASADAVLTTELACLRCVRSHLASFSWDQSLENTFTAATHHRDEQIQLSALGVLCESVRSTEPPPPSCLPLLLTFLSLNGSTQSPNFRYPIITAIKKLLLRIRDSSYAMRKLHSKRKGPDPHSTITAYQEFLGKLMSQQFSCLHPFSSYQRRHMALSVLHLLSTIFPSTTDTHNPITHHANTLTADESNDRGAVISPVFEFPSAVSGHQARRLVYALRDSYDANRTLVLELLCCLHKETLGLEDTDFLENLTRSFHNLMCSPKAVDCTTASYLLRLLLRTRPREFNHSLHKLISGSTPPPLGSGGWSWGVTDCSPHWVTLSLLLSLLWAQLERARGDLVTASVQSPLYGVMQSIRATLEEAKAVLCDVEVCKAAMGEVVELCGKVATLASPVVCNSSPEGFLPGSQGVPVATSGPAAVRGAGAQSLLLCCWHAMKETSLLMGLVVEWAPVGDSPDSLLTRSQVDSIAGIFIHQLTEARHRGAFEMAYSGFQKLCQSLWGSPCHQWQQMPRQWVGELLESLQSRSMSRLLSITRRSAGLPFFLQAILTSEPSHTGRPCLKKVMQTLLSVARTCTTTTTTNTPTTLDSATTEDISTAASGHSDSSDVQPHSASVHSLNILRALYRDSRLGEHVVAFIPEGVEIAVLGFSASLWPVRNSSTLLFSALVLRVFGAKRVQDEHSVENKMTGREFFTRFPTLHSFLRQQLEKAAQEMKSSDGSVQCFQLSLFPVLLILSRLYPTTLDEPTSPASLHSFLPLLLQCSSCAVWKTRVLISRTVVPLATPHNLEGLLEDLLRLLSTDCQNSLHTALLTLQRLLLERGDLLDGSDSGWRGVWLLEELLTRGTLGSRSNPCPVTRCSYLDLLTYLLSVKSNSLQQLSTTTSTAFTTLLQEAQQVLFQPSNEAVPSDRDGSTTQDVLVSSVSLLYTCASRNLVFTSSNMLQVPELVSSCLQHSSPAVRQYTLQYIVDHPHLLNGDEEKHSSTSASPPYTHSCERDICLELEKTLNVSKTSSVVHSLLVGLFSTETDEGVLSLLCHLLATHRGTPHFASERELCAVCLDRVSQPHLRLQLRVSLILFLSSLLERSHDSELAGKWLSFVEPYTLPTAPVELRQAVALGLGRLWRILLLVDSEELVEQYSLLVVALLQDGAEQVRDDMAASVVTILSSCSLPTDSHSQCPSSSSALQSFLLSLPVILSHTPQSALTILLHLVDLESSLTLKTPTEIGNLLFEEDPLNNYMEEVTVLVAVCRAVESLLSSHSRELKQDLAKQVKDVAILLFSRVNSSENGCAVERVSPWDEQHVFHGLCKVALLSEALVNGAGRAGGSSLEVAELLNDVVHSKLLLV